MKGDESSKERGMEILKGCFIFGILLSLAPSIVSFLTNQDISNLSTNPSLPSGLGAMLEKIISMIQTLGAVIILLGLIYGGYQYIKNNNIIINSISIILSFIIANFLNLFFSLIFYLLTLISDIYSTKILINKGEIEDNPIMRYLLNKFNIIKSSILIIFLWELPSLFILAMDLSIFLNFENSLIIAFTLFAISHLIAIGVNYVA
ncbi:MAG: hypothetical protein QXP91_10175 [Candidatus Methanomethylicia archaeon]